MIDLKELENFIFEGKGLDYSSDDESPFTKEVDGSTTIISESGKFKSHDNYFGGEPYGGREVIFYENKPLWILVYYGLISKDFSDHNKVYAILKKALREGKKQKLFRGPEELIDEDFTYSSIQSGDISEIDIEEMITFKGNEIYKAKFMGGLVDRASE